MGLLEDSLFWLGRAVGFQLDDDQHAPLPGKKLEGVIMVNMIIFIMYHFNRRRNVLEIFVDQIKLWKGKGGGPSFC